MNEENFIIKIHTRIELRKYTEKLSGIFSSTNK